MIDPSVTAYLDALSGRAQRVLGSELVGVYAAGSLALDAYQHGPSDIDVAIVCRSELDLVTKEAIVRALAHESLPVPARGLELVVYRADVAAAGTSDPGFEVELNTGPRMDFRVTWSGAGRHQRDGTFWYAIDRSILAEHGRTLLGPPAAEVFRSVRGTDLIDLLIASLRWHLESGAADSPESASTDTPVAWTADAALNACRGWQRVRTGRWLSKSDAGRQLLADDTSVVDRVVVEQAVAARSGGPAPTVTQTRHLQRQVLAALVAIAAR